MLQMLPPGEDQTDIQAEALTRGEAGKREEVKGMRVSAGKSG